MPPSSLHAHHKLESLLLEKLSGGFPYSKSLHSHTNCVNAIAFSKGDGRWMASAGDDANLYLWDLFHNFSSDGSTPIARFATEPRRNVLALAFNASNDKIYSVGTHARLVEYDISRVISEQSRDRASHIATSFPSETSEHGMTTSHPRKYETTVYSVSTHPTHPNLVITSDEDGLVRLHDVRSPGAAGSPSMEGLFVRNSEINDAQWCPATAHSFVVAQADGNVCLLDSRMAFSSSINPAEDPRNIIQRYATWVSKPGSSSCCAPEPSSLAFSSDGLRMAITLKNYVPVVYDTFDVFPLAQLGTLPDLSGETLPQGTRSYVNSCTVKHGSFGGASMGLPDDSIYCAGSDDFRAYAWAVPPNDQLKSAGRYYDRDRWADGVCENGMGFTTPHSSQVVAVPSVVTLPSFRLGGHRSIVNTAAFHPSLPLIVTAGVESNVLIHGTHSLPGGQVSELPENTRPLPPPTSLSRLNFRATVYGLNTLTMDEIEVYRSIPREDRPVLMFDEILRLEENPDVFQTRLQHPLTDDLIETFNV